MKILNLTQHAPTDSQLAAGVDDVSSGDKVILQDLLTFNSLPTRDEINSAALNIAELASSYDTEFVLIGGAPFLMGALESALKARGLTPLYAFSQRQSTVIINDEGVVTKVNDLVHLGFVEA